MSSSEPAAAETESLKPEKPKVGWGRYFHSFVVIPALVALFFTVLVYIFTAGQGEMSVTELLDTIRDGHRNVRWQAAVDLSRRLSDPALVPDDNQFADTLLKLFEDESVYEDDVRVRLFLALAMGRVGRDAYVEPLLQALRDTDRVEEQSVYIRAIGFLRDERGLAVLMPLLSHDDAVIRHEAVQALGNIGAPAAREQLYALLEDPEPNVRWDTAVSLAKLGDAAGRDVLLQLLDRDYFDAFPDVRAEGRTWAMVTAIRTAALLDDPSLDAAIKKLSESDPNIKVKGAALDAMQRATL
ncbi:MAG: HEAT repeat domain-containing protein [Verrucomicrobia bacterium]|nr:HEAT repeat domain-containing protein [Verrucomicrobiota bacterium]